MLMMGELTFFLGMQVKQMKQGMFVHQAKYTKDMMKKFDVAKFKPVSTLMSMAMVLDPDENDKAVDLRLHGRTFSLLCACLHSFRLLHPLHIGKPFNGSLGISNAHSNFLFGTPLLHHLILLGFLILILGFWS
jgi:hypothetical protein